MISKRSYQDALMIQDACNLSGVVHSWATILSEMVKDGMDTETIWHHPINILFSSKVASLTGSENFDNFSKAYVECQKEAE